MDTSKEGRGFISQISDNLIFKFFPLAQSTEDGVNRGSKLVCRNNADLFYANGNSIRMTTVGPSMNKYRLLESSHGNYEIKSLVMNTLGTLMAVIGDEQVTVVSLPASINSSDDSSIPSKDYQIKGIRGKPKVVLWHTAMANDCGLVILNDKSEIQLYDLSISSDVPQVSINDSKLMGQEVVSMSFGSRNTLAGALTLFVVIKNTGVCPIYPFTFNLAKISTKKEQIENQIEEITEIISEIDEEFLLKEREGDKNSLLRASCVQQYEYYNHLLRQSMSNVPPIKEFRGIFFEKPEEYLILEQALPPDYKPVIQAPLSQSSKNTRDFIPLYSNKVGNIFAAASNNESDNITISYYAQLRPLIMKFWSEEEKDQERVVESKASEEKGKRLKHTGYIKPKKGFGFVDLSDTSDEEQFEEEDNSPKAKTDPKFSMEQSKLWIDKYTSLSSLAVDVLPIKVKEIALQLFPLGDKGYNFAIKIGTTLISSDISSWIENFFKSILTLGRLPEFLSEYNVITNGRQTINSLAVIKDRMTYTGEYIILLKNGSIDNLEVKRISVISHSDDLVKIKRISAYDIPEQPVLQCEPFDEIYLELNGLKQFSPATLQSKLDKSSLSFKVKTDDVKVLKEVHLLSNETIKQVAGYTKFMLHFNFRIEEQLGVLKSQVETLKGIEKDSKINKREQKLTQLIEKQGNLDKRVSSLQDKLLNKIQILRHESSLPLSNAENKWFKEINSIAKMVQLDSDDKESINYTIKNLESQVKYLKELERDSNNIADLRGGYSSYLNYCREMTKLKYWLDEEAKLIEISKIKLEDQFKKLSLQS
ncbi:uncharacterized protein PRCAT00003452001 [Priceomyces carsonii]|uniref:uncharacterized protein n=1 Tax=Priceomyces carsonii TaxID=28549 RepID=UPI002EDAC214|nr:unnamed protein product [Priceomyces carsonii]